MRDLFLVLTIAKVCAKGQKIESITLLSIDCTHSNPIF